ncbi:hypothetical protein BJX99DRAFT_256091 [Aspergillus californicus]
MAQQVDLLIVGAGLHGLIMAKTYREVHPSANLLVVDESQTVGGTWARERLYPGLKTNNIFGSYELSDLPMVPERYGVEGTGHIPGYVVHEYLCDVAERFGITSRLRLGMRVMSAVLQEDRLWEVHLRSVEDAERHEIILARTLVIATGLTSNPHVPQIPGSETFEGLILHSKQLREQAQSLAESKAVVVVGGNKSAWDVCYTAARAGSQVHMIIRPSGGGPSYLWPRRFSIGPFQVSLAKLSTTRLFTLFDPAPIDGSGRFSWMRKLLHQTRIGRSLCQFFWGYLDTLVRRENGYGSHPEVKKLEPWTTPFWMGNSLSIHNYETSWFDLVREGKIHVHISDVATLSPRSVHLADGTILDAGALVLCTGWATDIPVQLDMKSAFKDEEEKVTKSVYANVPYLSTARRTPNAPTDQIPAPPKSSHGPLLYRDMIPAHESYLVSKNIAFIGMSVSIHAVLVAQAQALWITSFLANKLDHLRPERIDIGKIQNRASLDRVYGRIRRPKETGGLAGEHGDLVFDSLPYVDGLLDDLGVSSMRKNWWKGLVEGYHLGDYQGLVQEWVALQGMDGL